MTKHSIGGGFILLSRKLLKSGIMEKPALYLKLWIWMLIQAMFKDHGNLKRGQFFTSYKKMQKAMVHKVGYRTVTPTKREIQGVTKFLTKVRAIVTTKVLHGMIITILNYDYYQNMKNYEGSNESSNECINDVPIKRKKVIKKEKTPDLLNLKKRYPNPDLIDRAFQAIASTRKSGKVSDSVLYAQLQKWGRYPIQQVEAGIRIYLEKDYAGHGKREAYLLGIIRNQKSERSNQEKMEMPHQKEITVDNVEELYEN